jgi:ribosomal protein S18 acetylase RimI-like enzyme
MRAEIRHDVRQKEGRAMQTVVRLAGLPDLGDVQRIARSAYAMYVARIGREPAPMVADFSVPIATGHLWVAVRSGSVSEVMGFVVAYPREDHWHLENVAVEPSVQGTGLGGRLIAHVEAMARSAGAAAVELYTNAQMIENQRLYPRLGYTEIGRAIEDGFDRVFYRKGLS